MQEWRFTASDDSFQRRLVMAASVAITQQVALFDDHAEPCRAERHVVPPTLPYAKRPGAMSRVIMASAALSLYFLHVRNTVGNLQATLSTLGSRITPVENGSTAASKPAGSQAIASLRAPRGLLRQAPWIAV